jgi:hypothetical protein
MGIMKVPQVGSDLPFLQPPMSHLSDMILLVEDIEDDVFAPKRAYGKAGLGHPLRVATDGRKAVDYLTAAGPSGASPDRILHIARNQPTSQTELPHPANPLSDYTK